jgi:hypothetical protein
MAKNCALCSKKTSFLDGGTSYNGKYLCGDCYDEAIKRKSENGEDITSQIVVNDGAATNHEQFYIKMLRILAWVQLVFSTISSVDLMLVTKNGFSGLKSMLTGIIIFILLLISSYVAENISMIRRRLESKEN